MIAQSFVALIVILCLLCSDAFLSARVRRSGLSFGNGAMVKSPTHQHAELNTAMIKARSLSVLKMSTFEIASIVKGHAAKNISLNSFRENVFRILGR